MLITRPESTFRPAAAGDADALAALRARAGEAPEDARLRAAAARLDGAPTWVALRGSAVVAATSLVPLRTFVEGKERRFGRWSPPLVAPELSPRARLRVALELARTALDEGVRADGCVLAFALLDPKTWRVAERELAFEQIRHECLLVLEPGDEPDWMAAVADADRPVEELRAFDHQALWLHERCAPHWGASTVRDDRWYAARLRAEGEHVHAFGVRDEEGVLRGLVFVEQRAGTLDVLDLLVPPDEQGVTRSLLARVVAESGARRVRASVPAWTPWFARLQDWGFRCEVGPRVLAARSCMRRLDLFWLRDHWWHQPLDVGTIQG